MTNNSERHCCTAEAPWHKGLGPAIHPDAKEVGEQEDGYPGGDIVTMECPHCRLRFKVELPQ